MDQEAEHNALDFFYDLQKKGGADQRNIIIIELRRFGSRKRIIYCANIHESVLLSWVKCLM